MNQFKKIFMFELRSYLQNKTFIIFTVVVVFVQALLLFAPRVMPMVEQIFSGQVSSENVEPTIEKLVIHADFEGADEMIEEISPVFMMYGYEVFEFELSADELRTAVSEGEINNAVIYSSVTNFTVVLKDAGIFDNLSGTVESIMDRYLKIESLVAQGMTKEEATAFVDSSIKAEVEITGVDQTSSFGYTYILIFLLYMAVLFYGNMVASSVVTEKTSRAMEVLITSAKPHNFIFGKVLGTGLAGLLQLSVMVGAAVIFYNMNLEYLGDQYFIQSIFAIPLDILLYMLLFFFCGFFIYAFLFGAVGSIASKMEDMNSLITPVMLCFIAAFFVTMTSLGSGDVDSLLIKICSFIPLTSPMAMFTRIAMGTVPSYEIIISVVILVLSTAFIGWLASRIYRVGVLMYGNKPSIIKAIKLIGRK